MYRQKRVRHNAPSLQWGHKNSNIECKLTWLCSKHHFITCVSMTTPVLPTPALQCTTMGDFLPLPSSLSANLCTESTSSKNPILKTRKLYFSLIISPEFYLSAKHLETNAKRVYVANNNSIAVCMFFLMEFKENKNT